MSGSGGSALAEQAEPRQRTQAGKSGGVGLHLAAIAMYALVSLVATWPMPIRFTTEALGDLYLDRAQNIWNLWWVKEALLDKHVSPFHTDLLLYPHGADLFFHTLNLPSTLVTLIPLLVFGPIGAYNFSALFALAFSGYAGFRLVRYLTNNALAGLLGGLMIGFNPLSLAMLQGMINIVSLQWFVLCVEFYLRAMSAGRNELAKPRRDAALAGLFFGLAVLAVGYFEVLLAVFFMVHLIFLLLTASEKGWRARIAALARPARSLIAWGGGTAAAIVVPYALGSWLSLQKGQVVLWSFLDPGRTTANSADLLSFIVPNRHHWLLGANAPWWGQLNPALHDFTYLGFITLILASAGVVAGRRTPLTWFWVALAALGVLLALGPVLHVNEQSAFGGVEIPMPFSLLQQVPLVSLVRFPERFVLLTYLAFGALGGQGIVALTQRGTQRRRVMLAAIIACLLLLEMPLHSSYTDPMPVPASIEALARQPEPGAVLELPFTQYDRVASPRMYYQVTHGRPINSAYLSRTVIDPYTHACSPLQVFSRYPDIGTPDIISPTAEAQMPALLTDNRISFISVYKQGLYHSLQFTPTSPRQLADLQALADQLGTPVADDEMAAIYRVRPASERTSLFLQLGPDWHQVEESYGQPFRWVNGAKADLCVFSPSAHKGVLSLQVASFGSTRHLQVWVGEQQVLRAEVAADGALHKVSSPQIEWGKGGERVRLVSEEGSVSPQGAGRGTDKRQLSLGFAAVRVGSATP